MQPRLFLSDAGGLRRQGVRESSLRPVKSGSYSVSVNVNLLIDNIVRQTTVLVAQLATAAGGRAPLAHVAGQVFVELVRELESQGLGNKVIADMFGLTLRTYHDRVRRASESVTDRGSSLWEAVLRYARQRQLVSRAELPTRFRADDEASVRGVLSDLLDSGLLFKSGRGDHTTYRAASDAEASAVLASDPDAAAAVMVWVLLHQSGPRTAEELARELNLGADSVQRALVSLLAGAGALLRRPVRDPVRRRDRLGGGAVRSFPGHGDRDRQQSDAGQEPRGLRR
jgi:hypothetical protein